jgi:hypothetical protein
MLGQRDTEGAIAPRQPNKLVGVRMKFMSRAVEIGSDNSD